MEPDAPAEPRYRFELLFPRLESQLTRLAHVIGFAKARKPRGARPDARPVMPMYLPTPDEIRERTAEIRAEWSDDERERRAGCFGRVGWVLPEGV